MENIGYVAGVIVIAGVALVALAIFVYVRSTEFCDGCKRPTHKCSCEEDRLGIYSPSRDMPWPKGEMHPKPRRKPLDSEP